MKIKTKRYIDIFSPSPIYILFHRKVGTKDWWISTDSDIDDRPIFSGNIEEVKEKLKEMSIIHRKLEFYIGRIDVPK